MRQKHAKKPFNARFTDEVLFAIEDLSTQWDLTITDTVSRAVLEAHAGLGFALPKVAPPDVSVLPPDEKKAALAAIIGDTAPVKKETFAEKRARETKEHLATVAENDTAARAAGREDIEYDPTN